MSGKAVLIIGATRGLGANLAAKYASSSWRVLGTSRSSSAPKPSDSESKEESTAHSKTEWLTGIDITEKSASEKLVAGLKALSPKLENGLDTVLINAGFFGSEEYGSPDWEAEIKMYTTSCVAPVFLATALAESGFLRQQSKLVLVTSESGSITLRHEKEGGGNYGHHASKAAENMVGKLLSLDLKPKGVAVALVHPGFMRTEMTKNVGYDQYWDAGGAVTPDVAAESLKDWVESKLDIGITGTYWAPRGPR
jgi:short-subunit dehydrogenase